MAFIYQIILFYFILIIFALLFSNAMIFQRPSSSYTDSKEVLKLKTKDGALISAIYLPNQQAKYVLLVSHGNATDIGYLVPLFKRFKEEGFSVFAYDYRGYGTSEGRPSEKKAYLDVEAAYDYLVQELNVSPDRIIAYGRSVGAALTIDLASRKQVAAVIVQSPFVTAFRALTQIPILPFDKFNNLKKIMKVQFPILIIHGTRDTVIPFWQGKKIYNKANSPKYYYWVEEAGHNDLFVVAEDRYWEVLHEFVETLNEKR